MRPISALFPLSVLLLGLSCTTATAQTVTGTGTGVGVGTTTPDASAALDISSSSKGVLFPRVALSGPADASTVPTPAPGLVVFNTTATVGRQAQLVSNTGTASAPVWAPFGGGNYWGLSGNAATLASTNFLGTTDNVPLTFRVNNQQVGQFQPNGAFWVGSSSSANLFLGYQAGQSNTSGYQNQFIGFTAGQANTTGTDNLFIGSQAGVRNTTGIYNTLIGHQTGFSNVSGTQNTFIGFQAGNGNTANGNSFVGFKAGYANTTGTANAFFGYSAGLANTTGSSNTFTGYLAGQSNSTGDYNTFIGQGAGLSNTTGAYNTYLGREAGGNNNTGSFNTFVGQGAGNTNQTGYSNVFLGRAAGSNVTNGYNNTFLGPYSGISSTSRQLHNAAAIGYSAQVDKDDAIVLGGTGFNAVNVGVGIAKPDASALLDLTSTNRGALLPRVALTGPADATSVPSPAQFLLLINTSANPGLTPGVTINMGTPAAPQWTAVNPAADPAFLRTSAATLTLTAGLKTILVSGPGEHEVLLPDAASVPGRQYTIVRAFYTPSGNPANCTLTVSGSDIVQDQQYGSVYNGSNVTPPNNIVVGAFTGSRITSLTIQSDGGAAAGGIGWVVINKY